jgi:uncharacterized protein YlxP (DUF503 family)
VADGFVGVLVLDFVVPGSQSLKEKRSPLRSSVQRLRSAGYSVSEVAGHDSRQRSRLAVSMVAREASDVDRLLDEAIRICERPDVDVSTVQRSLRSLEELD